MVVSFQKPVVEKSKLATAISERAATASEKVAKRVNDLILPTIKRQESFAERWLQGLKNDFYILVDYPDDECGGGEYHDWTGEEIRELYSVLYDEDME
jgi:hypothetical protein